MLAAVVLLAVIGTPRAQPAQRSIGSLATELQDGLTSLIAMAQDSDQRATAASKRLELMRNAMGGDTELASPPRLMAVAAPVVPSQSVWDFSPVAAALIQSLLLAIATLTPLAIAWAAWEMRSRTGVATKQADAAVLGNAVRNSIGAMEERATRTGGQPDSSVARAYVLAHAGQEAKRLGVDHAAIDDKIAAQVGLQAAPARVAFARSNTTA